MSLVVNLGAAATALAGGVLGQVAGLRWTLLAATAITVLCALPTLLSPLRTLPCVPAPRTLAADETST